MPNSTAAPRFLMHYFLFGLFALLYFCVRYLFQRGANDAQSRRIPFFWGAFSVAFHNGFIFFCSDLRTPTSLIFFSCVSLFFLLSLFFFSAEPRHPRRWPCVEKKKKADGMLRETAHEMSLIAFEKKQLLQQWKGALIGLARRDEALVAATNALKEAEASAR